MALPAGCFVERQGRVGVKGLPEEGAPGRSLHTRSARPGEEMRVSRQTSGPGSERHRTLFTSLDPDQGPGSGRGALWGGSWEGEGRGPLLAKRLVAREFGPLGKVGISLSESSPLCPPARRTERGRAARVEIRHLRAQGPARGRVDTVRLHLSSSFGSCLPGNGLLALGPPGRQVTAGIGRQGKWLTRCGAGAPWVSSSG